MCDLRYFQTYDAFGVDSGVELQYWDRDSRRWEPVEFVRVRESEEEDEMTRPPSGVESD